MAGSLDGKVAIVTGASSGLGAAIAEALVEDGGRVVASSRTGGERLAALIGAGGVTHVAGDITAPGTPERLVEAALDAYGGLDVLVNNVGTLGAGPHAGFLEIGDDAWREILDVNLLSAIRVTRAALPALLARGAGAIVNVSSMNALRPDPSIADYAASKAALTSLGKSLSLEFAPRGIRVNTISPGPVRTELWTKDGGLADILAAALETDRESAMTAMADGLGGISLGRFGTPREIAALVRFLVCEDASFITGSDVLVDGGLVKTV